MTISRLNLSRFGIRRGWWLSILTRLATVVLLAAPMLNLMLASHTPLAQAAGALTITDLTAPNIIGDSNIESKAGEGPEVFTIGAEFCNTGDDTLKDVFAYIGDGTTPGAFPTTVVPPGGDYDGTFALNLLDADKSEGIGIRMI